MFEAFDWEPIEDSQIVDAYGDIDAWSRANGRKMGKNDIWIAATALVTSTTILTTDKDFDHLHDPDPSRTWRVDREWVDPSSKLPP
jgi:tRNA(fMet)-specific endonuclease VapC